MRYRPNKRCSVSMGLVLTALFPALAKAAPPQVGEPAPALGLEKLLQAPDGAKADWDSLRGKVVVLDFWATWCVPCLADIPFLNTLQKKYKDKAMRFISITDEPESVVNLLQKESPINGWIGLDTDGSAFKAFGISRRPTTIVVDRQGRVVGWTGIDVLVYSPEILDDLLAGKPRTLPGPSSVRTPEMLAHLGLDIGELAGDRQNLPLCLIAIRPAKPVERKHIANTARASFNGDVTLRTAIGTLYEMPAPRIISTVPLPEDRKFDVIFSWNKGDPKLGKALLRQAIEATFALSIRREKRMMDVYVLTVPPGRTATLEPGMSGVVYDPETGHSAPTDEVLERMNAGEKFFFTMGYMKHCVDDLSYALDRPVVDETDIDGHHWFCFSYDLDKPDRPLLIKTVEEKYGLKLALAKREIEVLVVERSSADSAGSR